VFKNVEQLYLPPVVTFSACAQSLWETSQRKICRPFRLYHRLCIRMRRLCCRVRDEDRARRDDGQQRSALRFCIVPSLSPSSVGPELERPVVRKLPFIGHLTVEYARLVAQFAQFARCGLRCGLSTAGSGARIDCGSRARRCTAVPSQSSEQATHAGFLVRGQRVLCRARRIRWRQVARTRASSQRGEARIEPARTISDTGTIQKKISCAAAPAALAPAASPSASERAGERCVRRPRSSEHAGDGPRRVLRPAVPRRRRAQ